MSVVGVVAAAVAVVVAVDRRFWGFTSVTKIPPGPVGVVTVGREAIPITRSACEASFTAAKGSSNES
jgi:hypothetical protein